MYSRGSLGAKPLLRSKKALTGSLLHRVVFLLTV